MISLAEFLGLSLGILSLMGIGVLAVIGRRLSDGQREMQRRVAGLSSELKVMLTVLGKDHAMLRRDGLASQAALQALNDDLKRLAADVVQREVYRGGAPDHVRVAHAVRDADDVARTAIEHGLSQGEVDLLVSLHGVSEVGAAGDTGHPGRAEESNAAEV